MEEYNQIHNEIFEVVHINTHGQLPDVLTKTIKIEHFINLKDKIDVVDS